MNEKLTKRPKRLCMCPKRKKKLEGTKDNFATSSLQTFDRIQWLRKRVLSQNLVDRTIKLKYLKHMSEMKEYFATKRVFNRFDDDKNRLLEAKEVKMFFDKHKLVVRNDAIEKLFRSTAINRSRGDPCNELTLYEFCLFAKSEQAAGDFKKLMENIKENTIHSIGERKGTSMDSSVEIPKCSSLKPVRGETYVRNLPSSFNALMNHFKDEEARDEMRDKVEEEREILEKLPQNPQNSNIGHAVESSVGLLKKLIESHFPEEEIDDQYRKLLSQNKNGNDVHKRMQEKMMETMATNRGPREDTHRKSLLFGVASTPRKRSIDFGSVTNREGVSEISTERLNEKMEELNTIIDKARKDGKREAQTLIRKLGSIINQKQLLRITSAGQLEGKRRLLTEGAMRKPLSSFRNIEDLKEMKMSRYYNKELKRCLEGNLVMKRTLTNSDSTFRTTLTGERLPEMFKTDPLNAGDSSITPKPSVMVMHNYRPSYYTQYKAQKDLQNQKASKVFCVATLTSQSRTATTANPTVISRNIHMRYKKTATNK